MPVSALRFAPVSTSFARRGRILDLQKSLKLHGFNPGALDGIWGPRTLAALKEFQSSHGLRRDGILGPKTQRALHHVRVASATLAVKPNREIRGIFLPELKQLMPRLSNAKAVAYIPFINSAMVEGDMLTPARQAAFLAQLAHESGELKYMEEIASGADYEGRRSLGNTKPGDGKRFKGRGPLQLTGRANYTAASAAFGIDLINHPELAAEPELGFRIATWFWRTKGLNRLADAGKFERITQIINGGKNGRASRNDYYESARRILS